MPKIRRGNFVFLAWSGDHAPRHVHVYRDGRIVVKWDRARPIHEGHGYTPDFAICERRARLSLLDVLSSTPALLQAPRAPLDAAIFGVRSRPS